MLQIKNVNLNVGNTALLSNINLTLEQGKIYGVLGPNGAGKTTLFKSMLGLTAFSGEILSDGQPVSSRCFGTCWMPEKSCSLNFLWGCANDWELLAPF